MPHGAAAPHKPQVTRGLCHPAAPVGTNWRHPPARSAPKSVELETWESSKHWVAPTTVPFPVPLPVPFPVPLPVPLPGHLVLPPPRWRPNPGAPQLPNPGAPGAGGASTATHAHTHTHRESSELAASTAREASPRLASPPGKGSLARGCRSSRRCQPDAAASA